MTEQERQKIIKAFYEKADAVLKEVPRFIKHKHNEHDLNEFDELIDSNFAAYRFNELLKKIRTSIDDIEKALIDQCPDGAWDHSLYAMYNLLHIAIAGNHIFNIPTTGTR